jgi:hypothetical protein
MSDTVRKVDYFKVMIPNKAGQASMIAAGLAAEGVNLLAFSGFPSGRATQLDLMPEDSAKLKRAAKKLGLELSTRKSGFLFQGDDRIGAMSEVFRKLADARINLIAVDAVSSGKGRFGAIFWVEPEAVAKTAKLLGAG